MQLSLIHLCRYHISMIHHQQDTPCTLPLPPSPTHSRHTPSHFRNNISDPSHQVWFGGGCSSCSQQCCQFLTEIFGQYVTKNRRLWKKIRPLGNFKCSECVFGKKGAFVQTFFKILYPASRWREKVKKNLFVKRSPPFLAFFGFSANGCRYSSE
jgi:hypothetical protein